MTAKKTEKKFLKKEIVGEWLPQMRTNIKSITWPTTTGISTK